MKHTKYENFIIFCLLYVGISMPQVTFAHADHAHGPEEHKADKKTQNGLMIPKQIQSHLGIVTQKVAEQRIKGTVRLVGHVISDPSGYARLQATQNARVMNDPNYPLPLPGQKVQKNQVVLALQPTLNKVEFSDQKSMLYKIESEIVELKKEVNRKEKLGEFASQKDLENARTELQRAINQKEEMITKTFKPEYLTSPLDGIIADLHVRPGEIVTPDKTIVEVVSPSKLLVEAFVFDANIADDITGGIARLPLAPDKGIRLEVLGVSPKVSKEDQSIHVLFKAVSEDPSIKLDMAVEILGELKSQNFAIAIPKRAIVEDAEGTWVFIKTAPEIFKARKVHVRRTIEEWVEIEDGLSLGEEIVVDGAYLLNQAR